MTTMYQLSVVVIIVVVVLLAPCGLRGCKNWPAPFPGRICTRRL